MPQDWIASVDLHSSIFFQDRCEVACAQQDWAFDHRFFFYQIEGFLWSKNVFDLEKDWIAPIDLWKRSTVIKSIPPIFKKLDREWIDPVDLLKRSMGAIHRQSDHSTACLVYSIRIDCFHIVAMRLNMYTSPILNVTILQFCTVYVTIIFISRGGNYKMFAPTCGL